MTTVSIFDPDYPGPPTATWPDEALVWKLREGSERGYEQLVESYGKLLYAVAARFTKNHSDTEDLLQEVWLRVFRGISYFQGRSSLKTWLVRICVNTAINRSRSGRRHEEVDVDEARPESGFRHQAGPKTPEDYAIEREQHRQLEMALERIAPILREAAVLRFITQLSTEEIAGILGVGLSAVKMRVQRGRQALAEELRDPYGGPVLRLVPKTAE